MSKNSPNLAQQLKNLQQEAETLEQTVQHRKSELVALQSKLKALAKDITEETARLKKAQAIELDKHKKQLTKQLTPLETQLQELVSNISESTKAFMAIEDKLAERTAMLKTVESSIYGVKKEYEELQTATIAQEKVNNKLNAENFTLIEAIDALKGIKDEIDTEIIELKGHKKQLDSKVQTIESDYEAEKTKREAVIKELDLKILHSQQELDEHSKIMMQEREDLAIWRKSLDEQDKNLRIREKKLSMNESKIIRNSNLLNL